MRHSRRIPRLALAWTFIFILTVVHVRAADNWQDPADELARRIAAQLGSPTGLVLTLRNTSTLTDVDVGAILQALRSQLRSQGFRFTRANRAKAEVRVTCSENADGYLWIAEIRSGDSRGVRMVSVPRVPTSAASSAPEPLSIRRVFIFEQEEPILDFAFLGPDANGIARLVVLEPGRVVLFGKSAGAWVREQAFTVSCPRPWPRDPRGRLIVRPDQTFDAYLPGMKCTRMVQPELRTDCRESEDSWPMSAGSEDSPAARFVADRNFFEGRLALGADQEIAVPPFFSAAELPGGKGRTWAFAGLDGQVRLVATSLEPVAAWGGWGSSIVSLKTGCGKGWQLLATRPGELTESDSLQAFEVSGRRAVAVGAPVEFPGPVMEMWPSSDGATAGAIVRNLKTGRYVAFTLSISCGE